MKVRQNGKEFEGTPSELREFFKAKPTPKVSRKTGKRKNWGRTIALMEDVEKCLNGASSDAFTMQELMDGYEQRGYPRGSVYRAVNNLFDAGRIERFKQHTNSPGHPKYMYCAGDKR